MPAAQTKTTPKPDVLADFKVSTRRASGVHIDKSARRALVPEVSDAAYVTRGVRVIGRDKIEVPVLVLRDGSQETTFSLAAVGQAIENGVITKAEIASLLSES